MREHDLGNPNDTRLRRALERDKRCEVTKQGVRLRAAGLESIRNSLLAILEPTPPKIEPRAQFIPDSIWRDTRPYIESLASQANITYAHTCYDAAAVMIRRLTEVLIIDAYCKLGRQAEITDHNGNFVMLGDLATRATGPGGLGVGRNAKRGIEHVKALGDRAAHNRRAITRREDLDRHHHDIRTTIEELIHEAGMR